MDGNVEVSILCITYNHKDFIEKTLEGFLMQKTNFDYEIIIHDDASTDGTREILLKYKEQYPDKIKLMLEEENQYSKGKKFLSAIMFSEAQGKYIAICEGDDEWIYEWKLQRQYDLLETDSKISLCVHNAIKRDCKNNVDSTLIMGIQEGYLCDEDIYLSRHGHLPTASYFLRKSSVDDYPKFCYDAPVEDETIRYHCGYKGQVYYMDEMWSIWNYMHEGSWNSRVKDAEVAFCYAYKMLRYLFQFNDYSKRMYEKYVSQAAYHVCGYYLNALAGDKLTLCTLQHEIDRLKIETSYDGEAIFDYVYKQAEDLCIDYYKERIAPFVNRAKDVCGSIYIYGAGIEAKKREYTLRANNVEYAGFVVSDGHRKSEEYLGHKVYELSDIKLSASKVFFILGLDVSNRYEVMENLRLMGYNNIL